MDIRIIGIYSCPHVAFAHCFLTARISDVLSKNSPHDPFSHVVTTEEPHTADLRQSAFSNCLDVSLVQPRYFWLLPVVTAWSR